ncbi:MAG TPA: TetR/AcrR family transcriptional regulator [Coleofasciculaceae cyanobacterium]|jgi:AcrR family transcriptional regulator
MGRKLGRPKAGQELLTRDRILKEALRLIDEHGVKALSMRRLATELGVDPMAIYHHLPGKQAILTGLIEIVFNEVQLPSTEYAAWQDQVRAFAQAYHRLTRAHPNLVLYLVTDPESCANAALVANEVLYTALAAAGLSVQAIVRTADLVVDYLNGFALAESSGRLGHPGERQHLLTRLDEQQPDQFPTIRWVFSNLTEDEILADIEVGLDIILAGIEVIVRNADKLSVT